MGLTLDLALVGVVGELVPCLGVVCGGHSLSSSNVRRLGDGGGVVETLVRFFCLGVAGVCEVEMRLLLWKGFNMGMDEFGDGDS